MSRELNVFVGLFGLDRSLQWTGPSIRRRLLDPLREAGCQLTTVAHFNQPRFINNPRSGEIAVAQRRSKRERLSFDLCWREPQGEPALINELAGVTYRDETSNIEATRRNLALQLHSLSQLGRLAALYDRVTFDAYLIARPDLEYIDQLSIDDFEPVFNGSRDIITADWHTWGGRNDRFCLANRAGANAFLNRGSLAVTFAQRFGYIHAEELLAFAIATAGLRECVTSLRARRVRATGLTLSDGFDLGRADSWKKRLRPFLNPLTI